MKILVAVKRVPGQDMPIRLSADGGIDPACVRMVLNPFDETALEQALRLREGGIASEVICVSCGTSACIQTLRTALAYGTNRAILVETDAELQSLATAKLLAAVARRENAGLVLCGKQATDTDAGETGAMLAGLLGWGQATAVSALHIEGENVIATCETDVGQEVLALRLPAIISADLRLNQPRYLTLQGSMKAIKKNIDTVTPQTLQADVSARLQCLGLSMPPPRKAGVRVADVNELVMRLRTEAGVI